MGGITNWGFLPAALWVFSWVIAIVSALVIIGVVAAGVWFLVGR